MNPRLKSSVKWTAFPKEYIEQIRGVFHDNFAQMMGQGTLIVEGRLYPEEILLRVGYREEGRLMQANFEVSMEYSNEKGDAVERIHNCIDAAASMMMEYFDNGGEVDFPRQWKAFPFQSQTLFLQFSSVNTELEAEADRLLGETSDEMVQEAEGEDALDHAQVDPEISPDRDEDPSEEATDAEESEDSDDDGQPRMFGSKSKRHLH